MVRCALIIIALTIGSGSVTAQLTDQDTAALRAELSLAGSFSQGTVDRTLIVSGLDIAARDEAWGVRSTNTFTYGTFASTVTDRDLLSRTFVYAWPGATVYPYAMLWAERGIRRAIDVRWQPGVGVTWVPWRDTLGSVRLSATASHEWTEYARPLADGAADVSAWRGIMRLAAEVRDVQDVVRFRAEGWVQPRLDDLADLRSFIDASLSVRVAGALRCRLAYTYIREHEVPSGASPMDVYASVGLTYTFH
jgi:hypothetical protein